MNLFIVNKLVVNKLAFKCCLMLAQSSKVLETADTGLIYKVRSGPSYDVSAECCSHP